MLAVPTSCLYPPGDTHDTRFCWRLTGPQGHSAAGSTSIMSMKNSSHTIGNRTRDLLASSTVPEPTAPPRDPIKHWHFITMCIITVDVKFLTFIVLKHNMLVSKMYWQMAKHGISWSLAWQRLKCLCNGRKIWGGGSGVPDPNFI